LGLFPFFLFRCERWPLLSSCEDFRLLVNLISSFSPLRTFLLMSRHFPLTRGDDPVWRCWAARFHLPLDFPLFLFRRAPRSFVRSERRSSLFLFSGVTQSSEFDGARFAFWLFRRIFFLAAPSPVPPIAKQVSFQASGWRSDVFLLLLPQPQMSTVVCFFFLSPS